MTDVLNDLGPVSSISAGLSHTCATKTDGTVQCWGHSTVPTDLGPVISISAEFGAKTCAVKTDVTSQCCALNSAATVPADLGIVSSTSAGYDHFCAVKTDGSIQCWGSDVSDDSTVPAKPQ